MNNLIDLKKKYLINDLTYKKDNFLEEYSSDIIFSFLKLIKVEFKKVLVVLPGMTSKENQLKKNWEVKYVNFNGLEKEYNEYDLIISNFSLHLAICSDPENFLNKLNQLLKKNGLLIMNLLNNYSFRTLQRTIIEIDEILFKGAYQRFGPFAESSKIIEILQKNKFSEVVASNDTLEVNYKFLSKMRSDIKSIGARNFNMPRSDFNRGLYLKLNGIFQNLTKNQMHMPVEYEITTFTAWK